jgi:ADP-heptose:LPS heptosyltransferase
MSVRIITKGTPFVLAEPGSLEAVTGRRPKRKPGECDGELWVNMGAGGLGDALLGLCAIRGLRARLEQVANLQLARKTIIYKVAAHRIPFVALFDGGYDGLADHDWDATWDEFPEKCDPRDLQMNLGYKREIQHAAEITRLERYCRNLGCVTPQLPTLRNTEAIAETGKQFAGYVVLCPFTDLRSRDWPLFYWLALEDMLHKAGMQTIVLGSLRKTDPMPVEKFRSAKAIHSEDAPIAPELTAGILLNAACVVSADSGLAHLAGIMGRPTIIVCGWSVGAKIYSFYPKATSLQGCLPCNGCWSCASRGWDEERCQLVCDNLSTILPQTVFDAIVGEHK